MGEVELDFSSISRIGVLGHSGSGKTTSAHVILEEIRSKRQPIVILDHKDEYAGLPDVAVLSGPKTNPRTLPKILKDTKGSVVVSMGKMGVEAKRQWVASFLLACEKVPRSVPIMVVVEEVRLYCPQKGKPVSKEPIIDLVSAGRSRGYGSMLVSQRASQIEKDAISQTTDLIILRHPFKSDIDYFEEWLGRQNAKELPNFEVRKGFHVDMRSGELTQVEFPLSSHIRGAKTPEPQAVAPKKVSEETTTNPGDEGTNWIPIIAIVGVAIMIIAVIVLVWISNRNKDKREEEDKSQEDEKGEEPLFEMPRE